VRAEWNFWFLQGRTTDLNITKEGIFPNKMQSYSFRKITTFNVQSRSNLIFF